LYRLFIGITLPQSIVDEINRIAFGIAGARWLKPEQMHLTLRFIGEVDGSVFRDIGQALYEISEDSFDIYLQGVGLFPPRGKPRVIWAGVAPSESLSHLQKKIESVVVRAGLSPDGRKFTPHVVMARLKDIPVSRVTDYLVANSLFQSQSFAVDEFCLISSQLGSEGASYQIEEHYDLTSNKESE